MQARTHQTPYGRHTPYVNVYVISTTSTFDGAGLRLFDGNIFIHKSEKINGGDHTPQGRSPLPHSPSNQSPLTSPSALALELPGGATSLSCHSQHGAPSVPEGTYNMLPPIPHDRGEKRGQLGSMILSLAWATLCVHPTSLLLFFSLPA